MMIFYRYIAKFLCLAIFSSSIFQFAISKDDQKDDLSFSNLKKSRPAPDLSKFKQRVSLSNNTKNFTENDLELSSGNQERGITDNKTKIKDLGFKEDQKEGTFLERKVVVDLDDPEEKKINPNLNNVSLSSFIKYMAELKKINLIPSTEANESKVTLTLRESLSIARAWEIFLTVVDSCGFCLVKIGDVHKVIKKDSAAAEPIRVVIGASEKNLEESSEIVRAVVFLKNIPVAQAEGLVKTFLDPKAQTFAQQSLNALVLTDRSINIKSALTILNELDNSGLKETCYVIRLTNATASDVTKFLGEIIKRPEISSLARLLGQQSEGGADFFPGTVKLIADDRTNSVIMLGIESALNKLVNFIEMYFEGSWQTRTPFETHICQYCDCEQMKSILDEIINNDATKNSRNSRGLGSVRMESDKYSNKLIIYAQDARDLNEVKALIKDLDKPQPMIAIEAMIVTVDEDEIRELGGKFRLRNANSPVKGIDFQGAGTGAFTPDNSGGVLKSLMGNLLPLVDAAEGSSVLAFGSASKNDVFALLKAFKTNTNNNIINKPFITVANNYKAVLHSGSTRSVRAESSGSGSDAIVSYKQYDASTDFNITPQISPDGLVNLDIDLTISDFASSSLANNEGDANKLTKNIKTKVTLADGGFLILGGFVKTNYSSSANKTPVLGDIPLLGWFSKSKKNRMIKSYTFMFVSPTIIKPQTTPGCGLYTKIKLHGAKDCVDSTFEYNPNDPVDNWFFQEKKIENAHKILDFANAKYQPTTVDVKNDELYKGKKISMENFYKDAEKSRTVRTKIPIGDDFINIISQEDSGVTQEESLDLGKKIPSPASKLDYDLFHGQESEINLENELASVGKSFLQKTVEQKTEIGSEKQKRRVFENQLPQKKQVKNFASNKKISKQDQPASFVKKLGEPQVVKAKVTTVSSENKTKERPRIINFQEPEIKYAKKDQENTFSPREKFGQDSLQEFSKLPLVKKVQEEPLKESESFDDIDHVDFDKKILAKTRSKPGQGKSFVKFFDMDVARDQQKVANSSSKGQEGLDDFDSKIRSKISSRPRIVSL